MPSDLDPEDLVNLRKSLKATREALDRNTDAVVASTEAQNRFTDTFEDALTMLEQLTSRFDTRPSEYVRGLIRDAHRRTFPAYAALGKQKALDVEPELTPEQACEQAGGKVEIVNGIPMCVLQISSSMTRKVPLSKPELFKK